MTIELSKTEAKIIKQSLEMYANWIETNNPMLSATDMAERKKKSNELSFTQVEYVKELRQLADKIEKAADK